MQVWIDDAILRETASKSIALGDLVTGKPDAFVELHSAAMLALVTSETDLNVDKPPETLLLDIGHLRGIQLNFEHIVKGATMLTTAEHEIKKKNKDASPEMKMLIDKMLTDTANQIIDKASFEDILKCLQEKSDEIGCLVDPTERSNVFTTLERQINRKDDAVRRLL